MIFYYLWINKYLQRFCFQNNGKENSSLKSILLPHLEAANLGCLILGHKDPQTYMVVTSGLAYLGLPVSLVDLGDPLIYSNL